MIPTVKPTSSNAGEFIGYLFYMRTQAHIYHLQTRSYAQHKALDDFYNEIVGLADGLAETYQGCYGIIKKYSTYPILEDDKPLSKMEDCLKYVNEARYRIFKKEDTNLQNDIDNIVSLIESTIYKLQFLS
jgi:hypothetical protein